MVDASGKRNKVVARYKDGMMLKGYTHDFTPTKETFHITSEEEGEGGTMHEVRTEELKALFFVKSLGGNREYREKKTFEEVSELHLQGIKIRVEFLDGEVLSGVSLGYNKNKPGFFLIPVDHDSNNERVYVVASSLRDVQVGVAVGKED